MLLKEILELVACDDTVAVQIEYLEPVFDALFGGFVLDAVDEPDEVSEAHLFVMLEGFNRLREDAFDCFPGESVAGVLGEFFPAELEVMVVIEFPEADVDDIEIFIAEEVTVFIDVWFCLDVEEALQNI